MAITNQPEGQRHLALSSSPPTRPRSPRPAGVRLNLPFQLQRPKIEQRVRPEKTPRSLTLPRLPLDKSSGAWRSPTQKHLLKVLTGHAGRRRKPEQTGSHVGSAAAREQLRACSGRNTDLLHVTVPAQIAYSGNTSA